MGNSVRVDNAAGMNRAVGVGLRSGHSFAGGMYGSRPLLLGRVDSGGLGGGGFDCAVGDVPASHANQAALEESGKPGRAGTTSGSTARCGGPRAAPPTAKDSASASGCHCDSPECYHSVGQHRTSGTAHVDAQACHEAVDLL